MSTTTHTRQPAPKPKANRSHRTRFAIAALVAAGLVGAVILAAFAPVLLGGLLIGFVAADIVRHSSWSRR